MLGSDVIEGPVTESLAACGEFDLAAGTLRLHTTDLQRCTATRVLVRRDTIPLGYVWVTKSPRDVTATELCVLANQVFSAKPDPIITRDVASKASPESPNVALSPLSITVAICTRDRPEALARCLKSLADVEYPDLEILVIDNAATSSATADEVSRAAKTDHRLTYHSEPAPGLSRARNAALVKARGNFVAFSDDDTIFSTDWVTRIADAFSVSVATRCVTGLVTSLQLVSAYDHYFEHRYPSWWTRMDAQVYQGDMPGEGALYPFAAGRFGTGANFAVHRRTALKLGGFDTALGAGTPAKGGEDLDMFVRMLRAGHELRYEPRAVVWHAHRIGLRGQLTQPFHYGTGCAAYITKLACNRRTRWDVIKRAPRGAGHVISSLWSVGVEKSPLGRQRIALPLELAGYTYGPLAYFIARRARSQKAKT